MLSWQWFSRSSFSFGGGPPDYERHENGVSGILAGLLTPAVQSARESGRRTSCQSNLRQIALAVSQFHDAIGHFPQGQCGGNIGFGPDAKTWSWMARILPYVEEKSIYQNGTIFGKTLRESGVADKQVRLFLCPSDTYSWRGPRNNAGNLKDFAVGQTTMADGATHYINEEIDLKIYRALATRAGGKTVSGF
jgi:type II secretory pathway pseudopilin PulG